LAAAQSWTPTFVGVTLRGAVRNVMYGRPPVGKGFFDVVIIGSRAVMYPACVCGRMCMTAGPEGVRGSGSNHGRALKGRDDEAECPDPGA
jgi:hypothetical protein